MDLGFEILVSFQADLSGISFERPFFEWQGERFPQGVEQAYFSYFKLIKSNVPDHVMLLLPDNIKKMELQCISVVEGVDKFVKEIERDIGFTNNDNTLINMLSCLLGKENKWAIVFEPEYDYNMEVLKGNLSIALQKIVDSLLVEKSGFIIWFEK